MPGTGQHPGSTQCVMLSERVSSLSICKILERVDPSLYLFHHEGWQGVFPNEDDL